MLDGALLKELQYELKVSGEDANNDYVSFGITVSGVSFNNILSSYEIEVNEKEIKIESGNLNLNVSLNDGFTISHVNNYLDEQWYITDGSLEIYINII